MNEVEIQKQNQSGEIDLFELIALLWEEKIKIFSVALTFSFGAILYLMSATSIFEAKVFFKAAQPADVAILSAGKSQLGQYKQDIDAEYAFNYFQDSAVSQSLLFKFFEEKMYAIYSEKFPNQSARNLFEGQFKKNFKFEKPSKNDVFAVLEFRHWEKTEVANYANDLAKFILSNSVGDLVASARLNRDLAVASMEQEIESARNVYKSKLSDEIVKLNEAISIAKAIGLKDPSRDALGQKRLSSSLDGSLLYMRGYKVLDAELEALQNRKQIDSFIPVVRGLQEKINFLKSISFTSKEVKLAEVDSPAVEPEQKIKPRGAVILVISTMIGGFIGVFVVLIFRLVAKSKKPRGES